MRRRMTLRRLAMLFVIFVIAYPLNFTRVKGAREAGPLDGERGRAKLTPSPLRAAIRRQAWNPLPTPFVGLNLTLVPPPAPGFTQKVAKLNPTDFEATALNKASIKTVPFTADELQKVGGKRIVQCSDGKSLCVFVPRHSSNPAVKLVPQLVPVEEYAKKLTVVEQFLNGLGYSLRTGPQDLGPVMRLRKKKLSAPPEERAGKKTFLEDPKIHERAGEARARAGINERANGAKGALLGDGQKKVAAPARRYDVGDGAGGACECQKCGSEATSLDGDVHLNPVDSSGKPIVATAGSFHFVTGNSCGEVTAQNGCKYADCLYDGALSGHWDGFGFKYPESQMNEWFGATFSGVMNSSECGANGSLNIRNEEKLAQDLNVFGITIPVLEGDVAAAYQTGKPLKTEHHLSFLGQDVESFGFDQNIPGPGAVIPVGPVPFTITSNLEIKLTVGDPQFDFIDPSLATCNSNQAGQVRVDSGTNFFCAISLNAGVDFVVLKGGIEGNLVLADDYFGVGLDSQISPSKDEVRVASNVQYRMRHLYGSLSLYVEVDLLFASKRFEVQLVDLGSGFGTNGETKVAQLASKTFKAVN